MWLILLYTHINRYKLRQYDLNRQFIQEIGGIFLKNKVNCIHNLKDFHNVNKQ